MLVRPIESSDLPFIRHELVRNWHDVGIWSVGRRYQGDQLPGFVAIDQAAATADCQWEGRIGLITYHIEDGNYQAEIVTVSSRIENTGVATALLEATIEALRAAGCIRAFLRATNDNLRALGFYQKRGWKLHTIHKGYIDEARKRAPIIPKHGLHGIPLRDEIELEMWLDSVKSSPEPPMHATS